jgi:hypothetical protein
MPYANLTGFERDRRQSALPDLFTVDMLSRYITWKLGHGAAADPTYSLDAARRGAD